jgi:hypothetical protein
MKQTFASLTFLSLLTFLLSSCQPAGKSGCVETHEKNGQSLLYVDLDLCSDTIDFDIAELVDSCRVIRLENRPEALIGRVSEMAFTDNRIYLYHQQKLLMAFDYEGKYREQIGNLGKGPYEYKYLNNMAVSTDGLSILGEPSVSDHYFIYDPTGAGKAVLPKTMGFYHEVIILNNNQIVEFGNKQTEFEISDDKNISLYIQDFSGKTLLERSPVYKVSSYRIGGIPLPIRFYRFQDEFRAHFSRDTLFNLDIQTGSLTPLAVFTASQNGYDYSQIQNEKGIALNTSDQNTGKVYAEIHAETPEYYLIRQIRQERYKDGSAEANAVSYFCIDKKKMTAHPVRLKDSFYGMDLDGNRLPMPFTPWSIIDNRYGVLDFQAIELKEEFTKRLKDPQLSSKLKTKLKALDSSISQEDNVVLFVYYLKTH